MPPATPDNPSPRAGATSWLAPRMEQSGLARYVEAVRARLGLVAACVALALAAAVVYIALAPRTYQAEADLMVTPVAADDPNLVGLPLVRDTSDPTADVLTVAQLVTSPEVADRVASQPGIGQSPQQLLGEVQAAPVTQSQIIAVTASAPGAKQAAALANAFASQTIAQRTARLHAQLRTTIPALRAKLKGLDAADRAPLGQQLAVLESLSVSPDPTLRVSSTAQPPTAPAWPRKGISLAAGGLAGLVLGLVAVFALQAFDPRLRTEEQLRELYRLPLLARLPLQRSAARPLAPGELAPAVAEGFRALRMAFTLDERAGGGGRAILVTGDSPAQGKTTVAVNLAASLARAGHQVVLVEADLRRPTIGRTLGITASYGITQVLLGEVELTDALVWSRPAGPSLELLLADHTEPQSVDTVSPAGARRLLREAAQIADYVVVDSPPLTDVGEALAFAEEADDVLVVARLGRSRLRKLSDLGELLDRRGIRPTGVVTVGVDAPTSDEYYYAKPAPAGQRRGSAVFGLLVHREQEEEEGLARR